MKTLSLIIVSAVLSGIPMFYAGQQSVPPQFGAAEDAKHALLKKNVEVETRLKQPIEWDVSIVTSQEVVNAIQAVATDYAVSTQDILDAGGNVQQAIQVKMAAQAKLCNDPNSTATTGLGKIVAPDL